ncbi:MULTISPECIES: DUF3179 domain-containing (seleno)protein [unclassified Nocardiopsis]|uniref:DUF3179 domain-containing (seleno)protein n=1 Tax=unclassified Nocardiopsis TaxID=2649073 RepID=UPI001359505B|nr:MULTISPECIES: DUF3179 domain-containing (seleno)protein [unclassified Nocardiopsis]
MVRPPGYGELYMVYRHRRNLLAVSATATLILAARTRDGRASPTAAIAAGLLLGAMVAVGPLIYDPFLFSRRRDRLRLRPGSEADRVFVDADTEVLGLFLGGEARAYPARALARPHAVTDSLGGERVTVSYCGLTNSAIAYRHSETGSSRDLSVVSAPNDNILYWDATTKSLVQQLLPERPYGGSQGDPVTVVPVTYTTWSAWHRLVPESTIAEPVTMSPRDRLITRVMRAAHMRTRTGEWPFLPVRGGADTTLHPKARVFALRQGDDARAYTRGFLDRHRAVNDTAGGCPVAVLYDPATDIAAGHQRHHDGRTLTFDPGDANQFRDRETGTVWNVLGRAVHGPLAGQRLEPVAFSFDKVFWFGWRYHHPGTALHRLTDERAEPESAHTGPGVGTAPRRFTSD